MAMRAMGGNAPLMLKPTKRTRLPSMEFAKVECRIQLPESLAVKPGADILVEGLTCDIRGIDGLVKAHNKNTIEIEVFNGAFHDVFIKPNETFEGAMAYLLEGCQVVEATPDAVCALIKANVTQDDKKKPSAEKRKYLLENMDLTTVKDKEAYKAFVFGNEDLFAGHKYDIGFSDTLSHEIKLKNKEPIFIPQFKIPHAHESVLDGHVDNYLAQDMIYECRSPYNSPVFMVKKPDGGLRLVQDFRALNANTYEDRYAIRDVRECIDAVGKARSAVFSTLDLAGAFWQLSLKAESRLATAFTLPHRNTQYAWKRAAMGLRGCPGSFSRLMGIVFKDLPGVITYVDDALVHSPDQATHMRTLGLVAERLRKHGLKLNIKKCFFGRTSVTYLGYNISAEGISPNKDKVKAIRDMNPPNTLRRVKEFLGLTNYFRSMVPNFSMKAAPLSELTKKTSEWTKGRLPTKAYKAFEEIRDTLCSEPVIGFPNPDLKYTLATDAAAGDEIQSGGLGAILTQARPDGSEFVVSYWSRPLKDHEKNYSAFALEKAAVTGALKHFHEYVYGRRVNVITDHRPMVGASKAHQKTINTLIERMNEYEVDIIYRKGTENGGPDALSRAPVAAVSRRTEDLKQKQRDDPFVGAIARFIKDKVIPEEKNLKSWVINFAPRCYESGGLIWMTEKRRGREPRSRLLAPMSMVPEILRDCHGPDIVGHWQVSRTLERVLENYFWPTVAADCTTFIDTCRKCQEKKDPHAGKTRAPLRPWPAATRPNERVHVDLFGPLKSNTINKYVMVTTCAYSKLVDLAAIPNKEAPTVARAFFDDWMCRRSMCGQLITDGGREFDNKVLTELCKLADIKKTVNSPRHPIANGQVEKFNSEMRSYLQVVVDETTLDWEKYLAPLMLAHNTAINRSTFHTPFYLTYLHDPVMPGSVERPETTKENAGTAMFRRLLFTRKAVYENNEEARQKYKEYYDLKAKARKFKPGDYVLVHYDRAPPGINQKLWRQWRGMYRVTRVLDLENIEVRLESSGKLQVIHTNRAKLFNKLTDRLTVKEGEDARDEPESSTPILDQEEEVEEDQAPQEGQADDNQCPQDGEVDDNQRPQDGEVDDNQRPQDGEVDDDQAPQEGQADLNHRPTRPSCEGRLISHTLGTRGQQKDQIQPKRQTLQRQAIGHKVMTPIRQPITRDQKVDRGGQKDAKQQNLNRANPRSGRPSTPEEKDQHQYTTRSVTRSIANQIAEQEDSFDLTNYLLEQKLFQNTLKQNKIHGKDKLELRPDIQHQGRGQDISGNTEAPLPDATHRAGPPQLGPQVTAERQQETPEQRPASRVEPGTPAAEDNKVGDNPTNTLPYLRGEASTEESTIVNNIRGIRDGLNHSPAQLPPAELRDSRHGGGTVVLGHSGGQEGGQAEVPGAGIGDTEEQVNSQASNCVEEVDGEVHRGPDEVIFSALQIPILPHQGLHGAQLQEAGNTTTTGGQGPSNIEDSPVGSLPGRGGRRKPGLVSTRFLDFCANYTRKEEQQTRQPSPEASQIRESLPQPEEQVRQATPGTPEASQEREEQSQEARPGALVADNSSDNFEDATSGDSSLFFEDQPDLRGAESPETQSQRENTLAAQFARTLFPATDRQTRNKGEARGAWKNDVFHKKKPDQND
jgi:hypothetical protein